MCRCHICTYFLSFVVNFKVQLVVYRVSMESIGHAEGALSALPWVPVSVGGSKFLAKARFGDIQYQLLLSDMNSVWEEEMNINSIEKRAQVRIFHTPTTKATGTVGTNNTTYPTKVFYVPARF